ncbi:MAG: hypothetical protein ACREIU_12185 [Planctomycetota bacterium]
MRGAALPGSSSQGWGEFLEQARPAGPALGLTSSATGGAPAVVPTEVSSRTEATDRPQGGRSCCTGSLSRPRSWAASAGSANIPLLPFGTLRLVPATLFVVAGGALDPQGRASLAFSVPGNPALVGVSLYRQAVVGPPVRFTNLEVTTVTGL